MKWLINWCVKKYAVNIVNDALAKYNVNVSRARAIVAQYIAKADALLAFLKGLDAKLADGKITEQEADALTDEAEKLAKELVA